MSYVQVYAGTCQQDIPLDDCVIGLLRLDYGHPGNTGDVLHFGADTNPWHSNGHTQSRLGEFLLYNEYDPRRAILFFDDGKVWRCTATIQAGTTAPSTGGDAPTAEPVLPQLLEQRGQVINGCVETSPSGSTCLRRADAWSDGDDVIFGDLGNDWLVGGTGKDTLWGGWGNDLLERRRRPLDGLRLRRERRQVRHRRSPPGSTTRPTRTRPTRTASTAAPGSTS